MKYNSNPGPNQLVLQWDKMKLKYPVIIKIDLNKVDPVKAKFLKYIDGVKNTDELRDYFLLNSSDAHYIVSDLLRLGYIRLIHENELFNYWKEQISELELQLEALSSKKEMLKGEHFYLSKQIETNTKLIDLAKKGTPKLSGILKQIKGKTEEVSASCAELLESISELSVLAQDILSHSKKIKETLNTTAFIDKN